MLEKKEIIKRKDIKKLYSMFGVKHYANRMYTLCWDEDYSALDAISELRDDFANNIIQNQPLYDVMDIIDTYIAEALKSRDWEYNNLFDICYLSLDYIFDKYIGVDIVNNMIYNDCVEVVKENNLSISQQELEAEYDKLFDYSYAYRETFYNVERYLKLKYAKNEVIEGLANQLNLNVGDIFTLKGIADEYTLTKNGIVCNNILISQQQLLHIFLANMKLERLMNNDNTRKHCKTFRS